MNGSGLFNDNQVECVMEKKKNNSINRRDFIKIVGISTAAMGGLLPGCASKDETGDAAGTKKAGSGEMTYRAADCGDKVSLLGYGCMRWPTLPSPAKDGNVIDQEAVNELVDYAIAHGVTYFDTSPVYMQGWSEKSTGIALKRHPREKWQIATKLSNFANYTRENSIAMYRKSFEDLQVDCIDY